MVGVLYKLFPPTRSPEKELEFQDVVSVRMLTFRLKSAKTWLFPSLANYQCDLSHTY